MLGATDKYTNIRYGNKKTNCFVCKRKRNEIEDGGTETLMLTGYRRPSPYSDCEEEEGAEKKRIKMKMKTLTTLIARMRKTRERLQ